MSEWISVKDRLPTNSEDVLVYGKFVHNLKMYYYDSVWWYVGETYSNNNDITHWMPFPNPPNTK